MTDELKPCPFCGGKADMILEDGNWFAHCKRCDALGPSSLVQPIAEMLWNRRAPDKSEATP